MSTTSEVDLLAERIAEEFNTLRGELPVPITQADYDLLSPPDNKFYFIIPE